MKGAKMTMNAISKYLAKGSFTQSMFPAISWVMTLETLAKIWLNFPTLSHISVGEVFKTKMPATRDSY
jgi:hypothetical protein